MTIDDLSRKSALTLEEAGALQRATIRHYAGEADIEDYFVSKGYEIINPDGMGLFEQIALFSKASHIAGLSGVGLFNMFWADTPLVYEICVNQGYYYHHQVFGEYTGAKYQKIEAYHSNPQLVVSAIESVITELC
jgi:capsular polysaccharide biosynthesis protein